MNLNLFTQEVGDEYARDNFRVLQKTLLDENLLSSSFKHVEIELSAAVTDLDYSHNLGYIPLDIITTYVTPGVTLEWKYDQFTRTTLRLSTDGACRIRAFIGSFRKGI